MKPIQNIDYYYGLETIDPEQVRALARQVQAYPYRKLATFTDNLEKLQTLEIGKIALVNYLTDRMTHRRFREEVDRAISYGASEIELYWVNGFTAWGKEKWRELIETYANEGVIIRIMLDIMQDDDEQLSAKLSYLRDIGVTDVAISSGTQPDVTTYSQWNQRQRLFPSIFRVKALGVKSKMDADRFLSDGVRFVGTRSLN